MGSSSSSSASTSKTEVKTEVKTDVKTDVKTEVKEVVKEVQVPVYIEPETVKKELEELKQEVKSVPQVITDGVKATFMTQEDVVSIRYSQLDNLDKINEDIKQLFATVDDSKILDFIITTATSMIAALKHSTEMKEVVRWHERKIEKRVGDKVVGMEAHYKVKIHEKTKGYLSKEKETIVLIAFKVMAHALDRNVDEFLSAEDLKSLTF